MKFQMNEYHRNISNEELINDLMSVYVSLGKATVTQSEYTKRGKYGVNTFRRRFGGWNQALELCGIPANKYQIAASKSSHNYLTVTIENLIFDLQYVAQQLGKRSFSSREYSEIGHFSRSSYYHHFESWNAALTLAGLEPYKQVSGKRIEDMVLLEEIERLWISLGRQPTATDIRDGKSTYTLNTYARHFGGWRNALVAFIDWIDKDKVDNDGGVVRLETQKSDTVIPTFTKIAVPLPDIQHTTTRDINLRLRFKVMMRDNFKCCACGASPAKNPEVELHIDHIIPWSKGGETTIDNLQTLCSKCNLGKSDLL